MAESFGVVFLTPSKVFTANMYNVLAGVRAVVSHGWEICSDVKPESKLEQTLYAIDELTGLVASASLVRPSKSVLDIKAKSVKKK